MGPFYTTLTEEASALVILTPLVDFLLEECWDIRAGCVH